MPQRYPSHMRCPSSKTFPIPGADLLATLLSNSHLIALAVADHERLLFANQAFRRLFGREQPVAGVPILDLLLPAYRESIGAALRSEGGPPPTCLAEAFQGAPTTITVE